jgi:hypothetical protein
MIDAAKTFSKSKKIPATLFLLLILRLLNYVKLFQ